MDRNNKSGRQKRITSGQGSVQRRGSGIGSKRPVGGSYDARRRSSSASSGHKKRSFDTFSSNNASNNVFHSFSGNSPLGRLGGGFPPKRNRGWFKWILLIILLLFIFYWLWGKPLFENPSSESTYSHNSSSSDSSSGIGTSDRIRSKYTTLQGDGKDEVTIMIYMCGTDLESEYGMATRDLQEMTSARITDKVNVIVETGGTKQWKNSTVSSSTNQIYRVKNGGVELLKDELGKSSMTDPSTLSSFIRYCESNYPADRYCLIFWDHGGGSISGYGYDQWFSGSSMTLDKIKEALEDGDCQFDFIGFDACLMATLETAMITEQYADYLIASEETEPGCGWYYTDWLTALSRNTSMPTVELAQRIIDDYTSVCASEAPGSPTTLSVIDLAELAGTVPSAFVDFSSSVTDLIENNGYAQVSTARSRTKEFSASSQLNQIDLIDFAKRLGTTQSNKLANALKDCIKYQRTSVAGANGVSIYFPYTRNTTLNSMVNTYNKIGLADEYSECIRSFASLQTGGQIISNGSGSALGSLLGNIFENGSSGSISPGTVSDLLGSFLNPSSSGSSGSVLNTILNSFSETSSASDVFGNLLNGSLSGSLGGSSGTFGSIVSNLFGSVSNANSSSNSYLTSSMLSGYFDSLSSDRMMQSADYYADTYLDASRLTVTDKNGTPVLKLTDKEWDLVQQAALNVFVDDGQGYIDLGLDSVYEFDEDGDLLLTFDGTWIALNGQIVSYYVISEDREGDSYTITGRVPVMLNGKKAELILTFTDKVPYGTVTGARYIYTNGETETLAKGLVSLQNGDTLNFLCDFYSYEGVFQDSYYLGDPLIIQDELVISNVPLNDYSCKTTYCLTDIYNNKLWTQALDY